MFQRLALGISYQGKVALLPVQGVVTHVSSIYWLLE